MFRWKGFGTIGLLAFIIAGVSDLRAETWKAARTYTLSDIDLSAFLEEHLGLANIDDHNIDLGGIGSDLWHSKEYDRPGIYWMITDRGPNGEDPRTFPVPQFTPFILKVKTDKGAIEILKAIPVTGLTPTENGVTGLPNLNNTAEPPALNEKFYDCAGLAGSELSPTRMASIPKGSCAPATARSGSSKNTVRRSSRSTGRARW